MEIICVPIIVSIVFGAMQYYKKYIAKFETAWTKLIPILSGLLGAGLGILCYYALPVIIPAANAATAMFVGAASGLSATGCNQIFKQLKTAGITVVEPENPETEIETEEENENKIEGEKQ
ncbi:MAG: hypothetical protein LBM01_04085 [Christensenellaceae bacterium]|jgi:hypothetical protein|nr:hypothetical protein [Christensenellaceae bacterium]